ncbi:MAG: hypothetical protein Q9192_008080 [Flavoplaca navasiana]
MAATAACAALALQLGAKVAYPGSPVYGESISTYLTAFESDLKPTCIVQPSTRNDVAGFMNIIQPYITGGVQIAIRAGGNQPFAGAANIAGGITIDLRSLQGVTLGSTKQSVSIGAGESWGSVYEKLAPSGLAVAGGRSSQGGIGGLVLGGGLSYLSTTNGFVSDQVLNFEVVLASGRIVNANPVENRDLWIAMKGGSNNFGIVTRFDMTTIRIGNMWGGDVFYPAEVFPQQINLLCEYTNDHQADPSAHLIVSVGYAAAMGGVLAKNSVYYAKPVVFPTVLRPFTTMQRQLEALRTLRTDTLKGFADEQTKGSPNGQRLIYRTTTIKANPGLIQTITKRFTASIEPLKPIPGLGAHSSLMIFIRSDKSLTPSSPVYSISFQPLPLTLLTASSSHGPNSFGLSPNDGPLMLILLTASWTSKTDDATIMRAQSEFVRQVDSLSNQQRMGVLYKLLTYATPGFAQDVISSYGSANKRMLQAVSRKYDPDGFFQRVVPGGFKLFT